MTRPSSTGTGCRWCSGACTGADLAPLLTPHLQWLWDAVTAKADRTGDADLTTGRVGVTAPADAEARAAATGLLGGIPLRAGQRRTVDLEHLTTRLRARGPALTPGAVAAHATGRRLAASATARAARGQILSELEGRLRVALQQLSADAPHRPEPDAAWAELRRAGWHARLLTHPAPAQLLADAATVLGRLPAPGRRVDRRLLVPHDPHTLDDGAPLAGLVLALTGHAGQRPRVAWAALGVDSDDLTGGLLALGIQPAGWTLPDDAVVTLPPRVLAGVHWPPPTGAGEWVFVSENPSVVAAAADLAVSGERVRLLCTVGTPSAAEVAAVGALASAGWRVAVRADFDAAGLAHVRALLAACPSALPWRMSADDYRAALGDAATAPALPDLADGAAPWEAELLDAMRVAGHAAFEEALVPELLADLRQGHPGSYTEVDTASSWPCDLDHGRAAPSFADGPPGLGSRGDSDAGACGALDRATRREPGQRG